MDPQILLSIRVADHTRRALENIENRLRRLSNLSGTQGLSPDQINRAEEQARNSARQDRALELRERQQAFRERQAQANQLEQQARRNFQAGQQRRAAEQAQIRRNFQDSQRRAREATRDLRQQRRLQEQLQAAQNRLSTSVGSIRGGFGSIVSSIADASFAMQAFTDIIGRGFRAVVDVSAEFERLRLGLAAIQGSDIIADEQIARIRELAELPNVTFTGGIRGFTSLVSAGASNELAFGILEQLSNAIALSGGRAEDLTEGLRQFGQLIAAGEYTQQDLRPILQRAPILRQAFTREFGTFIAGELNDILEAQGITVEQSLNRLVDQLAEGPRASAETFTNAVERLGDSIDDLLRDIGGGLLPVLKSLVNALNDFIQFLRTPAGRVVQGGVAGALLGGTGALGRAGLARFGVLGGIGGFLSAGSARGVFDATSSDYARRRLQQLTVSGQLADQQRRNPTFIADLQAQAGARRALLGRASIPSRFNPVIPTSLAFIAGGAAIGAGAQLGISSVEQAQLGRANALQSIISYIAGGGFNQQPFAPSEQTQRVLEGGLRNFNTNLSDAATNVTRLTEAIRTLAGESDTAASTVTAFNVPFTNIDVTRDRTATRAYVEAYDTAIAGIRESRTAIQRDRRQVQAEARRNLRILEQARELPAERTRRGLRPAAAQRIAEQNLETNRETLRTLDRQDRVLERQEQRLRSQNETLVERGRLYDEQTDFLDPQSPRNLIRFFGPGSTDRRIAPTRQPILPLGPGTRRGGPQDPLNQIDPLNLIRGTPTTRPTVNLTATGANYFDEIARSARDARQAINEASEAYREANRLVGEGRENLPQGALPVFQNLPVEAEFLLNVTPNRENVLRREEFTRELGSLAGAAERIEEIGRRLNRESPFAFITARENIASLLQTGRSLQDLITNLEELGSRFQDLEGTALFRQSITDPVNEANTAVDELISRIAELLEQGTRVNRVFGTFGRIINDLREPFRNFGEEFFGDFGSRFLRPQAGLEGIRAEQIRGRRAFAIEAERSIQEQQAEQQRLRDRLSSEIGGRATQFYDQFLIDPILEGLGIGGRSQDQLRDSLEDLEREFTNTQNEIRDNSIISERDRLDQLEELHLRYQTDRRELEKRFEVERDRAWRDWVKQQLVDIPLLILEQTKLRLAARATNFVLDSLGVGGGGSTIGSGIGSAAGLGTALRSAGSFLGQVAGPAAVIGTGFSIAEFFNTGIPADALGSVVNAVSGESNLPRETAARTNQATAPYQNLEGPKYIGRVNIGTKEVQEFEFVRQDLRATGQLPDLP